MTAQLEAAYRARAEARAVCQLAGHYAVNVGELPAVVWCCVRCETILSGPGDRAGIPLR